MAAIRKPRTQESPGPGAASAPAAGLAVRSRAWVEWDGRPFAGPGRATLLESVRRHGSISAAAREVGVTYRTAWRWVAQLNEATGSPLVETTPGGRGGGGARVTAFGEAVLELLVTLQRETAAFEERLGRDFAARLGPIRDRMLRPGGTVRARKQKE